MEPCLDATGGADDELIGLCAQRGLVPEAIDNGRELSLRSVPEGGEDSLRLRVSRLQMKILLLMGSAQKKA